MNSLDRWIFGSGKGLGMPASDQPIYWLVDAKTKKGTFYTFMGGFGAQLHSIQWTHPKAHEERVLSGVSFRPFSSYRSCGRVMVAWCTRLPDNLDKANHQIRCLEDRLGKTIWGPWPPDSANDGSTP